MPCAEADPTELRNREPFNKIIENREVAMFYVWLIMLLVIVGLFVLYAIVRSNTRRRTSPPGLDSIPRDEIEKTP
jgi:hypothetical protein